MSICDKCTHRIVCDHENQYRKECMFFEEYRPHGKWKDYTDDGYVECPFCGSATNCEDGGKEDLHYCFSCGARLRKGGE